MKETKLMFVLLIIILVFLAVMIFLSTYIEYWLLGVLPMYL